MTVSTPMGAALLQVSGDGANKSWFFRYEVTGRIWEEGWVGSLADVTLTQARDEAQRLRNLRATDKSIDPLEIREAEKEAREKARQAEKDAKTKERTVRQVVDQWTELHRRGLEPVWFARTMDRIRKYVYPREDRQKAIAVWRDGYRCRAASWRGRDRRPPYQAIRIEIATGERTGPAVDLIYKILMQPATNKKKRDDVPGPLWYHLTVTGKNVRTDIEGFIEYALNHGLIEGRNAALIDEGCPLLGRLTIGRSFT